MPECPWCRSPVRDLRVPCPKCGKIASDLRTTDPPGAASVVDMAKVVALPDVPDLVIPSPPKSKPSLPSMPKVSAPQAAAVDFDDDGISGGDLQIDLSGAVAKPAQAGASLARPPTPGGFNPFDDDLSAGPAIELDTAGGSLPPRASSPSLSPQPPRASIPSAPVSSRSLAPIPQAPVSKPVDAFDARTYADYGEPPDAFWRAPIYAWRVLTRRGELRRDLPNKREDSARTTKRVEDALVAFGERAKALAKGGPALDRVNEAEALVRNREGAASGTNDANAVALAQIDARMAPALEALAAAREEEARAQTARDAADEEKRRADAKLKRLDIELRNPTNGVRAHERTALEAELAQKTQRTNEAEQALVAAKQRASAAQAASEAIARERAAQESKQARQAGVRSQGADDAHQRLRDALIELGRAMLADSSVADLAAARDELARLESQAQQKAQALAVHESALDAFDKGKVAIGIAVIAVAALVLLGVVFFPFIYRAFAT